MLRVYLFSFFTIKTPWVLVALRPLILAETDKVTLTCVCISYINVIKLPPLFYHNNAMWLNGEQESDCLNLVSGRLFQQFIIYSGCVSWMSDEMKFITIAKIIRNPSSQ